MMQNKSAIISAKNRTKDALQNKSFILHIVILLRRSLKIPKFQKIPWKGQKFQPRDKILKMRALFDSLS